MPLLQITVGDRLVIAKVQAVFYHGKLSTALKSK